VAKKVCGACRCPLTFLGRFKPDGTPAKQRAGGTSKYMEFVKENHAESEMDRDCHGQCVCVCVCGSVCVCACVCECAGVCLL
jgi:hypothetical protein